MKKTGFKSLSKSPIKDVIKPKKANTAFKKIKMPKPANIKGLAPKGKIY